MSVTLSVNIDHVATLRNARGGLSPDPVACALQAVEAGAHGITVHLREDRRHIRDHDVVELMQVLTMPLNLEMAATEEMIGIATRLKPPKCTLVPERRKELTTEGGLDVVTHQASLTAAIKQLTDAGILVSLFVAPDMAQLDASVAVGAPMVELHTGPYADHPEMQAAELERITAACHYAHKLGLRLNAGHGLTAQNVGPVTALPHMEELNIGHSLISRAIMIGLPDAVREMLAAMQGHLMTGQK